MPKSFDKKKRKAENHHKYIMGGIIVKYFPPKALQYIMGHSKITMTLNYYAHATFTSAKAERERLVA